MKILLATSAGFCMGVRRAVEMVMDAPGKHEGPMYTYGPLIHNKQVLDLLAEKGITVMHDIPESGSGTVLIRAHGVPLEAKKRLIHAGFRVLDATCPRVIRVQSIIRKHAKQGYESIIIGDRDHPEVVGLLGYTAGRGHVVSGMEELQALPAFDRAILVSQTTQNTRFFDAVRSYIRQHHPHYRVFDTICDSTERRQAEVQQLASDADAILVVGDRASGNTRRLVEIAASTGKPSYHVETEADIENLDLREIASSRRIGITAGASTPNWIIKRVYRSVEALRYRKAHGFRKFLFAIQHHLMLTNLYVSLGAGALSYACAVLQGLQDFWISTVIAMLYVQSMHILNHFIGSDADRYNDPERAAFYNRHEILLRGMAFLAGGVGLLLALFLGWVPFAVLLSMSLLGMAFNLRLIPSRLTGNRYRRIRDVPGSKTVLIALAWGILTTVFPALGEIGPATLPVFLIAAALVFVRTAFFDVLDMQGDRIVGRETIALLLGEKQSLKLLRGILIAVFSGLLLVTTLGVVSAFGYPLLACPAFLYLVLAGFERKQMLPGMRLEFLVETHFVLCGCLALLWTILL